MTRQGWELRGGAQLVNGRSTWGAIHSDRREHHAQLDSSCAEGVA